MNDRRPQQATPAATKSRRRFLGAAAGLVGAAVAVPVLSSESAFASPEESGVSRAKGIDPYNGEPLDASVDCELSGRNA